MINIEIIGNQQNDGSTTYSVYSAPSLRINTNNWTLYNFFRDNPRYDWDTVNQTKSFINDYCMSLDGINFKKLGPNDNIVFDNASILEEVSWIAIAAHFAEIDISLSEIMDKYSIYINRLIGKFMQDPTTVQVRTGEGYSYEDVYDQFSMNFRRNSDDSVVISLSTSFFNNDNSDCLIISN